MSKLLTPEEFAQGLIDAGFVEEPGVLFYYHGNHVSSSVWLDIDDKRFHCFSGFHKLTEKNLELLINAYNTKFEDAA